MASMLGITAGATAVSGFAWFTTTKKADVDISNIGVYSKSSALAVTFKEALVGCADDGSDPGDIDVKTAGTETFTGDGTTTSFTLKDIPDAKPTVKLGDTPVDEANVSWTSGTKVVSLSTPPANGVSVKITYSPFSAVLTDVSSVDGQAIYKPTWTATGEGRYATAVPTVQEGFLRFSMTLEASGSSDLKVYLNLPTISPSGSTEADVAAAKIARVSIVEDADQDLDVTANVTRLVLQNNNIANNKGIDSTFVAAGKTGTQPGTSTAVFDMNSINVACTNFANPDTVDKSALSTAPDMTAAKNYITTVPAGGQTDIIVTVWLEGTNGNVSSNLYGSYDAENDLNPLNGSIDVSLPLIAF